MTKDYRDVAQAMAYAKELGEALGSSKLAMGEEPDSVMRSAAQRFVAVKYTPAIDASVWSVAFEESFVTGYRRGRNVPSGAKQRVALKRAAVKSGNSCVVFADYHRLVEAVLSSVG